MPEVVCNTSPLQYLHQVGLLDLLPSLARRALVPPAVLAEVAAGLARGIDLPDLQRLSWIEIRRPTVSHVLPLVTDLGPGETEVLALALETPGTVAVLDDGVARAVAEMVKVPFTGTLGILLSAKRAGLLEAVAPVLDRLQQLRFRLAPQTRAAVLAQACEG